MKGYFFLISLVFLAIVALAGTGCEKKQSEPEGACCFPSGLCVQGTQMVCMEKGGMWQGANKACEPNPCPQPSLLNKVGTGKILWNENTPLRMLAGLAAMAMIGWCCWFGGTLDARKKRAMMLIGLAVMFAALAGCEKSSDRTMRTNLSQRASQLRITDAKAEFCYGPWYYQPIQWVENAWNVGAQVPHMDPSNSTKNFATDSAMTDKNTGTGKYAKVTAVELYQSSSFWDTLAGKKPQTLCIVWAKNSDDKEFKLHDGLPVAYCNFETSSGDLNVFCFPITGQPGMWHFTAPLRGDVPSSAMLSSK